MDAQQDLKKKTLPDRAQYGFPANKVVEDAEGNKLHVGELDGMTVSPFGEKFYRNIKELPLRDDDVLLCGYPKTGCHWAWEILQMIVNRKAGTSTTGKTQSFLESITTEQVESQSSPRVLNTHVWFDYLPGQVIPKKTKIVLTVRNPKDVAASFYNHHVNLPFVYGDYNGSFKGWFQLFLDGNVDYGKFVDYHLSWHKAMKENPHHPIYVVCYENMKEDLPREIRGFCEFLGVELTESQVQEIAKSAGLDSMKNAYTDHPISSKLIRKGQVGDWKHWLTVAQSDLIDDVMDKKLAHTCFRFRYTL